MKCPKPGRAVGGLTVAAAIFGATLAVGAWAVIEDALPQAREHVTRIMLGIALGTAAIPITFTLGLHLWACLQIRMLEGLVDWARKNFRIDVRREPYWWVYRRLCSLRRVTCEMTEAR